MILQEQWRRPRVGQVVRLGDGRTATVVMVRSANMVLKLLSEAEAYVLSAHERARFGQNWRDVYYQAEVVFESGIMNTVSTSQVVEILEST